MVTEEVKIDARVHSRLIGSKGRNLRKISEDYNVSLHATYNLALSMRQVDVRFPRSDSDDKDTVTLIGAEDNVLDCKDHLLNLEEEYVGACVLFRVSASVL